MRKLIVLGMFAVLMMANVDVANAQEQKIGQVDIQYVLTALPEYKEVESQLQALEAQLMKQSQDKEAEFQRKYQDYLENGESMADVVRADRERELQQLQQSYTEFQQNAQVSLQNKSTELLNPLYTKIGSAIDEIAVENGYSHILNMGVAQLDIIIYGDAKYDVSNLVLRKLGVTPPAN
jgi:outer membrane protein